MQAGTNYFKLVKRFPLRQIRTREENEEALVLVAELSIRENELSDEEMDYFDLLSRLVEAYEKTIVSPAPNMTPQEVITFLMDCHGLRQIDIVYQCSIDKGHISAFLAGTRSLTKDEIGRLSRAFGISPLLLLSDDYFGGIQKKQTSLSSDIGEPVRRRNTSQPLLKKRAL